MHSPKQEIEIVEKPLLIENLSVFPLSFFFSECIVSSKTYPWKNVLQIWSCIQREILVTLACHIWIPGKFPSSFTRYFYHVLQCSVFPRLSKLHYKFHTSFCLMFLEGDINGLKRQTWSGCLQLLNRMKLCLFSQWTFSHSICIISSGGRYCPEKHLCHQRSKASLAGLSPSLLQATNFHLLDLYSQRALIFH